MDLNDIAQSLNAALADLIGSDIVNLTPGLLRLAGAALLAVLAMVALLFALRSLRGLGGNGRSSRRTDVPRELQREGAVIDLMNENEDDVAARCVVTSVSSGKVKCEIIERLDAVPTTEGEEVACMFAPMKADGAKVNSFSAKLLKSDKKGREANRIVLSSPTTYAMTPRRKHSRKRVADQQFIRVKLWIATPRSADISFEDAVPHIGVNAFASGSVDQSANAVINISHGGLGLSVSNEVIPETCAPGADVVINLFMFSFREKTFKPYWYGGIVRSMEEGRPGFTRMGLEFTAVGEPNEKLDAIDWQEIE